MPFTKAHWDSPAMLAPKIQASPCSLLISVERSGNVAVVIQSEIDCPAWSFIKVFKNTRVNLAIQWGVYPIHEGWSVAAAVLWDYDPAVIKRA